MKLVEDCHNQLHKNLYYKDVMITIFRPPPPFYVKKIKIFWSSVIFTFTMTFNIKPRESEREAKVLKRNIKTN